MIKEPIMIDGKETYFQKSKRSGTKRNYLYSSRIKRMERYDGLENLFIGKELKNAL